MNIILIQRESKACRGYFITEEEKQRVISFLPIEEANYVEIALIM